MSPIQARSRASFQSKLLLDLSNRKGRKNVAQQAFTLIELMIVVAIIGVLSAVALPNFLQARSAAKVGSRVGEAIGFAKECTVFLGSGIGTAPSRPASPDGTEVTCAAGGTTGTIIATWGGEGADGVKCLDKQSTKANTKATIALDTSAANALTCTFSSGSASPGTTSSAATTPTTP